MSEFGREARTPMDLSNQFLTLPFGEFLALLRSIKDTTLTVKIDIAQKQLDFNTLQALMAESHISHFTIVATEKEHDDNLSLFSIAGVDWEPNK